MDVETNIGNKMKLYLVKTSKNTYMMSSCVQSTKNKYLGLMTKELAERRVALCDDPEIKEIDVQVIRNCIVGDLEFGRGDTYSFKNERGAVLHETKTSIYIAKYKKDSEEVDFTTTQKHLKKNEGTKCFKTGVGYKEYTNSEETEPTKEESMLDEFIAEHKKNEESNKNEFELIDNDKQYEGVVQWWDDTTGKGMIQVAELDKSFFVHHSALQNRDGGFEYSRFKIEGLKNLISGQKVKVTIYSNFFMAQVDRVYLEQSNT